MRVVVILFIVGLVGAGALIAVGLLIPRDNLLEQLRAAPGYALGIPEAELLWESDSDSRGGAGANRSRVWAVHVTDDAVAAYFDEQLTQLGYERVAGPSSDPVSRTQTLAVYALGDVWYSIGVARLPTRVPGGRVLRSGYEGVIYTTISNAPERPGAAG